MFTLVNPLESKDADSKGVVGTPLNNEEGTQGATQHPRDVPMPTIEQPIEALGSSVGEALRDALREPSTLRFSTLRDSLGRTTSPEWNLDVVEVQDPSAARTRGGRQV